MAVHPDDWIPAAAFLIRRTREECFVDIATDELTDDGLHDSDACAKISGVAPWNNPHRHANEKRSSISIAADVVPKS